MNLFVFLIMICIFKYCFDSILIQIYIYQKNVCNEKYYSSMTKSEFTEKEINIINSSLNN
jgi:hypothetical protein